MSLFSTIFGSGGRARGAGSAAANSTLLPWHAFDTAVEHTLRMMRGVHVPVSFFALRLGAAGAGAAAEAVGDALGQLGPVGRLADGTLALLYLGPRKPAPEGADDLSALVRRLVEARLRERGWPMLATQMEIASYHGWADDVGHTADLVRALVWPRARVRAPGSAAPKT
jgi:hypothetical protein